MDSGLSDRGDRGDSGRLLSKYSSMYLQVHTSVHALTQTRLQWMGQRDVCGVLTRCAWFRSQSYAQVCGMKTLFGLRGQSH